MATVTQLPMANSGAPGSGSATEDEQRRKLRIERAVDLLAVVAGLAATGLLVLTIHVYDWQARGMDLIRLGLGGQDSAREQVGLAIQKEVARQALHWNFLVIAGYASVLVVGGLMARWYLPTEGIRRWVRFGLFAAVIAVVADCLKSLLLLRALSGPQTVLRVNLWDAASALAVVKICALIPAAATAAVGLAITGIRLFRRRPVDGYFVSEEYHRAPPLLPTDPVSDTAHPEVDETDDGRLARWARGYSVPPCTHPQPAHGQAVTGISLSGGGVRAASVALGVLQSRSFRERVVSQAQYLVSVSGGGYTAGAFAQALTDATPEPAAKSGAAGAGRLWRRVTKQRTGHDEPESDVVPDLAASAFMVGSPEEDHLRRHSSYIANTPNQMLTALGLLLGHLLMTLVLLFGPAILLGLGTGVFYRRVPITKFEWSDATPEAAHAGHLDPIVRDGALWALGITAGLTVLCLLAVQVAPAHVHGHPGRARQRLIFVGEGLLGLTVMITMVTVVLPRIMALSSWLTDSTRGPVQVASPIAGVLLTYAASLATLAWRRRAMLTKRSRRKGTERNAAPRGLVQIVLVIAALVMLAAGWLIVVGGIAAVIVAAPPDPTDQSILWALVVVLLLLGGLTDETTLSLHPFYRARLASAFAVRRVRRRKDGQVVAEPYPLTEVTHLSRYAAMPKGTPFPHIIFAASATLAQERTPPGSTRVSYTFCSDWVGGPEMGYVKTAKLESLAPPRLKRDLTVQGAMALSGAAIAASGGGQGSAWYEPLLVVSGVRLGAWMPNPAFMIEQYQPTRSLTRKGLPLARRINYLLRELFGVHTVDGPLLQVTDGGFYDNLGLLELFRRGCTRIYCVDASGDSPPAATTLARSLTRAYQELGVETTLSESTWSTATAGSGEKLMPADPLAALSQRLASTGIITGDFTYPDCAPFEGKSGKLVVAKASLWSGLPYKLMAYAHEATVFPHDSTADQWFDDRQYAAYTELGRWLGEAAVSAMNAAPDSKASAPMPGPTAPQSPTRSPAKSLANGVGGAGAGGAGAGGTGGAGAGAVNGRATDVLKPEVLAASPNGSRHLADLRRGFEITVRWHA